MEIKEIVAVALGSKAATEFGEDQKHSCDWAHCPKGKNNKGGPHAKAFKYPDKGKADLSRPTDQALSKLVDEKEKSMFEDGGYPFAVHHLVPIIAFGDTFPDLKTNAELAGYNVNDKINLMALHTDKKNVQHLDLQYHAGNHGLGSKSIESSKKTVEAELTKEILTAAKAQSKAKDPAYSRKNTNYKDYVTRRLTYTEKLSLVQCWQDKQGTGKRQSKWLRERLALDSDTIRRRIKNWNILLVKAGLTYRKGSAAQNQSTT